MPQVLDLFNLHGKNAQVTGASRGLGAGMALALAQAGANVVLHLTNEWSASRVDVNAIAPRYKATNNAQALRSDPVRSRQILERLPAGRWGQPEGLTDAVVFLASPAGHYIHGHVLAVGGGWLAR